MEEFPGSARLRPSDVRRLLRLQAELGELPVLSPQWKQHALARLLDLVPAKLAFMPEQTGFQPGHKPLLRSVAGAGLIDDALRSHLQSAVDQNIARIDPLVGALTQVNKRLYTRRRCELVPDRVWYRSPVMQNHYCVSDVDDSLISVHRLDAQGWTLGLGLYRARGDRRFSERDRLVVHLLHAALRRTCGKALRAAQPSGAPLSPREHETLGHLLAGSSEKEIARRMDLSPHTVHQYVKAIYRRFEVSSRAELLVRCLASPDRRREIAAHRRPPPFGASGVSLSGVRDPSDIEAWSWPR